MEKEIIKKFTRFLKEKGVYKESINEFKKPNGAFVRHTWAESEVRWKSNRFNSIPNETFESYCDSLNLPEELLNFAFSWGRFKEEILFLGRIILLLEKRDKRFN